MISNTNIRFLIISVLIIFSTNKLLSQNIESDQKQKKKCYSKLILKNDHSKVLLGKIIRIYKKGVIFDQKRESLLYDPKDEFYSFDEIMMLYDDSGNIIIDSLSNKNIDYEKYGAIYYQDKKSRKKKFGIKAGHNYSYFFKSNNSRMSNHYPASLLIGLFVENNLSRDIVILNELYFSQLLSKSSGVSDLLYSRSSKFRASYLHFNILMKLKTYVLINSYFLFGFDTGYLLAAKDERFLGDVRRANIRNLLHKFDFAILIGIGKRMNFEKADFLIEARYLYGLTEYSYWGRRKYDDFGFGVWKNRQFQILIGFQF